MRKLLDWIADKFGYQRKHSLFVFDEGKSETLTSLDWPPDYLKIDTLPNECAGFGGYKLLEFPMTQELLDDCILPPMTESEKEFVDSRPIVFNGD